MLPIAIDAMGGDHAPAEIVAGAHLAADAGIPVILVGQAEAIGDTSLEIIEASEVIAMDEDPTKSVRTKKDSSLVRAAEAVRDGRASGMISAGNTGAALAAATLRMRRIKGVGRPAIATPLPMFGGGTPNILIDAGANVDCTPDLLALFARMGAVYSRARFGVDAPRVGLLSNGEEASKGSPFSFRIQFYSANFLRIPFFINGQRMMILPKMKIAKSNRLTTALLCHIQI